MIMRLYEWVRRYWLLILIGVIAYYAFTGGFLSIGTSEQPLQWQGQTWAQHKDGTSSVSSDADSITLSTSNGGAYVRSDFDLSKYSEVRLLVDASTSAYISGNSASGNGAAAIMLDNRVVMGVDSHAEERGATNIPGDSDSLRKSAIIKRNGDVWELYENEIRFATVNNRNPTLKFQVTAGGNYGGGSARMTAYATLKSNALILAPTETPAKPSLSTLISGIREWLKRLLDAVPFLTIVGSQSPMLGTTQTYTVSLSSPAPIDEQYADGTYAVRYCNTALMKDDGTIIAEKGFQTCQNTYADTFTVTIPRTAGKYAVVAVMAESKGTFIVDTAYAGGGTWQFSEYEIIAKDALDITTKAPIPGASSIPLAPSKNLFAKLFDFLFGWLRR